MKKILFFAVATATMLSACSKNEVAVTPTSALSPLGFGTYSANAVTKADTDPSYAFEADDIFVVDAYYVAGTTAAAVYSSQTSVTNFMDDQSVKATGDSESTLTWSYSPLKYWPNNDYDRLSFFAYTNSTSTAPTVASLSLDKTASNKVTTANAIYPTLTVTDIVGAGDLMVASAVDQAKSATGSVAMAFEHVTSGVQFTALLVNDDVAASTVVTLTDLNVTYAAGSYYKSGTFVYNIAATNSPLGAWTSVTADSALKTYAVVTSNTTALTTTAATQGNPFYVIPVSNNKATVTVTYTVKTTDDDTYGDGNSSNNTNNTSTVTNTATFEITPDTMNTLYTYNIKISLTGVTVTGTTGDWATAGSTNTFDVEVNSSTETAAGVAA